MRPRVVNSTVVSILGLTVIVSLMGTASAELEAVLEGNISVGGSARDPQHIAHFKGRVLAENSANESGAGRNYGFSLWTDEAFGIEPHFSNSTWQTALFGRPTDSAALTLGAYAAGETQQQNFAHYMTLLNSGDVGIGTEAPTYKLDIFDAAGAQDVIRARRSSEDIFTLKSDSFEYAVMALYMGNGTSKGVELNTRGDSFINTGFKVGINTTNPIETFTVRNDGVIALEGGASGPGSTSDYAKFYAKRQSGDVEMFVVNENGDHTQLTSHKDPRDFAPDLQGSSFEDPEVVLPFSFHHTNAYIGKGAVVDLAAVVRDLEAMTGKSYTTHYDLPSASPERLLARYPWIEIPIEEAWEEYEAMVPERTTAYDYNLDEQTVYLVEVPTGGDSEVGTGILKRRLKENVRFEPETGKFLRRPTAAEIPPDAAPDLPAWIADRLASE